ncbi:MAG: hypothetical protein SOI51_05470 [Lactobacillus amylovorus]
MPQLEPPQDNVSYVTFKRNVMIDKVTKKIVDSLDWQPEKQTYLMVMVKFKNLTTMIK